MFDSFCDMASALQFHRDSKMYATPLLAVNQDTDFLLDWPTAM